ncbi:hypothetical protein N802_13595 [Knoellia sinensis KCTC 19936]|uniref:Uncharacterized protein n=1 Tax=Knoellia sinensis KCTC 19936 TaxID=1385520 RepID=A0A0A0JCC7_9MICO|nr:hypothetical protein N802_13595 [Knoellia sinensis KCTC 19936]
MARPRVAVPIGLLVCGVVAVSSVANLVALEEVETLAGWPIFGMGLGIGLAVRQLDEVISQTSARVLAAALTLVGVIPYEYLAYDYWKEFTPDGASSDFIQVMREDLAFDPFLAMPWLLAAVLAGVSARALPKSGAWSALDAYDPESGTFWPPQGAADDVTLPAAQVADVRADPSGRSIVTIAVVFERQDGSFVSRQVRCGAQVVPLVARHLVASRATELTAIDHPQGRPVVTDTVTDTANAALAAARTGPRAADPEDWLPLAPLCEDLQDPRTVDSLNSSPSMANADSGVALVALLAAGAFVAMLWGYGPLWAFLDGAGGGGPDGDAGLSVMSFIMASGAAGTVGWIANRLVRAAQRLVAGAALDPIDIPGKPRPGDSGRQRI